MHNAHKQFNEALLQNSYLDATRNYILIIGIRNNGERTSSILDTADLCLYYNTKTNKHCLDIDVSYKFADSKSMYQHYYLLTLLMIYYLKEDGFGFDLIKQGLTDNMVAGSLKHLYNNMTFANVIESCMECDDIYCLLMEYFCKFDINGIMEELN